MLYCVVELKSADKFTPSFKTGSVQFLIDVSILRGPTEISIEHSLLLLVPEVFSRVRRGALRPTCLVLFQNISGTCDPLELDRLGLIIYYVTLIIRAQA